MIFSHPNEKVLSKLLDSMTSPQAELSLRKHLNRCASCREKAQAFGQVKSALQSLPALEENVVGQPSVPLTIPSVRPHSKGFPVWGVLVLAAVSIFCFCLAVIPPPQPAMKVISSDEMGYEKGNVVDDSVRANSYMGNIDLEIPNQFLLRLRPGTTITWQQTSRPWFGQKPNIIVNLMRGELLARTKDSFWGSHLEVRTPMATTAIKGTAFSVAVNPVKDATVLKVLAGKVFFSPYLKGVGVNVNAGQTSQISGQKLPISPSDLAPAEKEDLLETYRIGESPAAALVIGGGPERVEELLGEAPLYISDQKAVYIQPVVRRTIQRLNQALLDKYMATAEKEMKILEIAVDSIQEPEITIPFRLYAGAWNARLRNSDRAIAHFRWVADQFPRHPLASVALTAAALVTQEQLHQPETAQKLMDMVISHYPKSPEAVYLKDPSRR